MIRQNVTCRLPLRARGYFWVVDARRVDRDSSPGLHRVAPPPVRWSDALHRKGKNPVAVRPNPTAAAPPGGSSPKRPIAGYLRSATELEGDSLRRQIEAIVRYARDHGMQLTRLYCDECGSGLRIDGRTGLWQLFRDIECGAGDFGAVLLLDPSRWSRSPDPEHGLVLEDRCRKAGIDVHYCAGDPFGDEIPVSTLVRKIERALARNYARKLTDPGRPRAGLMNRANAVDRPAGRDSGPGNSADAE
ncbi:MAG: recombinase family protein [Rhodospirillaceae bacterium]|nr:recombinase family protein [Rhodospirillaceae bacterium]MYH35282.1 recombinase family protein [Rhodospirillaceae bacterium]MYK13110.1 recombinase family protein [Rhodospirillaceae bacterium]MYK58550.1 recombinase family protein [Rhodospirillaceae bacterium]